VYGYLTSLYHLQMLFNVGCEEIAECIINWKVFLADSKVPFMYSPGGTDNIHEKYQNVSCSERYRNRLSSEY